VNSDKPVIVDRIEAICLGCRRSRFFVPDTVLVGATNLVEWLRDNVTPCGCGSKTYDAKCRMVADKQDS
jgi:hypothetical protein